MTFARQAAALVLSILDSIYSVSSSAPPSSSGLGRRPFKPLTGIRIPLGAFAATKPSLIQYLKEVACSAVGKRLPVSSLIEADVLSSGSRSACWNAFKMKPVQSRVCDYQLLPDSS